MEPLAGKTTTENLARAFASTRGILANIAAEQYGGPTPCASWKVRDLANHVMEAATWFAACVNSGTAPEPNPNNKVDYAAGDVLANYDKAMGAALGAFGAPGAQEKMLKLPFGDMPGSAFMGLATTDVFTHGWDLAKATGQPTDIDSALASQLLAGVQATMTEGFRGADGVAPFGPEVSAPASASAADKLAAFLGRQI